MYSTQNLFSAYGQIGLAHLLNSIQNTVIYFFFWKRDITYGNWYSLYNPSYICNEHQRNTANNFSWRILEIVLHITS